MAIVQRMAALIGIAALVCGAPAEAGQTVPTCWMHNGSLMRLTSTGDARTFTYEEPRAGLREIGVKRGMVLFKGVRKGRTLSGFARIFSTECPGERTEYLVEGRIFASQTRIVLTGRRELYRRCAPIDRFVKDTLVFTYVGKC